MQLARTTAVVLGVATVAFAAEEPSGKAAAPSAPPTEDAVAAAKRDLEAIKALRSGIEQPRADLPRFSAPEFPSGVGAPQRATPTDPNTPKKSANWLVEAMMKKPARSGDARDRRPGDSAEAGEKDDQRALDPFAKPDAKDKAPADDPAQRRTPRTKAEEAALNPLASYMANWMSLQDYKLLQPGLGMEGGAGGVARGDAPSTFTPVPSGSTDAASALNFGRPQPSRANTPARENPFLQAMVTPAPVPVGPGLAGVAPTPPPQLKTPPPAPQPEPPPQKSATPSFVKPNDDAKYFKPLKRF